MTELEEIRVVPRDLEEVFDYVADFSTTAEYDPGVAHARRLDPVGHGARFVVDAVFLGRTLTMTYTCSGFDRPHRLEFRGDSPGSRALDSIRFERTEGGTRIHWKLQLELKGASRWFEPLLGPALRRLGTKALDGLSQRLREGPARAT